jgi:hypothetical protein
MERQKVVGQQRRISTRSLINNLAFRDRGLGGCCSMQPLGSYEAFTKRTYPPVRTPEVVLKDLTGLVGAIQSFTQTYNLLNDPKIRRHPELVRQVYDSLKSYYGKSELPEMFILINDVANRFKYLTSFTPEKPSRRK